MLSVTHWQVEKAKDPRKKFDYNSKFGSAEKIANNVKPDVQQTYEALEENALEVHLIDNETLGNFLVAQFAELEKASKVPALRKMLVTSTNHVMGLTLLIKEKEGKTSYVVQFFDPNETTSGTRSKMSSAKEFEAQTLRSYVTNEINLHSCYPESEGKSVIFVCPEANGQTSIGCGLN